MKEKQLTAKNQSAKIDFYERLKKPFPKDAYDEDKSRGFSLTTIDAYHVIDRLNEVFGLCGTGWKLQVNEWIKTEDEIILIGELSYNVNGDIKTVPCVGGKRIIKNNLTDAYKSAMTNAICKGASFIGVGLNVYKGQFDFNTSQTEQPKPKKPLQEPQKSPPEQPTPDADELATPKQAALIEKQILGSHVIFPFDYFFIDRQLQHGMTKEVAKVIIDMWLKTEHPVRIKLEKKGAKYLDEYCAQKFAKWIQSHPQLVAEYNVWVESDWPKIVDARKENKNAKTE